MRIILGSFALVALVMLFVCGSKTDTQTVTTLSGNSQPTFIQTSDEVTVQDNVGSDEDEYGRPRNKDKKNRRHLFPRLRK